MFIILVLTTVAVVCFCTKGKEGPIHSFMAMSMVVAVGVNWDLILILTLTLTLSLSLTSIQFNSIYFSSFNLQLLQLQFIIINNIISMSVCGNDDGCGCSCGGGEMLLLSFDGCFFKPTSPSYKKRKTTTTNL